MDNGIVGHAYVFTYTPLALESTQNLVQSLGDELVGQTLAPVEFETLFARRLRLLGRTGLVTIACAGLDMATWDALAKLHDLPLAALLDGRVKPVPAYDSHNMDGEEIGLLRAGRAMEAGLRAIKMKIGYRDLAEDCHIVELIQRQIGDDIALMVDCNQSLSVPEVMHRIRTLQPYGLAWVEEPTLQEDYAGHARIRATGGMPIQMGENWCGVGEMQWALDANACDLVMPDVMKIGEMAGRLKAATLAELRGLPMSSHIFQEISAHLLAVTPTAHWLERMGLADRILRDPCNSRMSPPLCPTPLVPECLGRSRRWRVTSRNEVCLRAACSGFCCARLRVVFGRPVAANQGTSILCLCERRGSPAARRPSAVFGNYAARPSRACLRARTVRDGRALSRRSAAAI
ncbi:mandelate racemase [Azoarcus sp. PA01]|nr:mandelate racemase [Azoarcus sp. PA01]KAI5913745.1 mandelate racemase [Azoarcus sp. PA01]